MTIIIEGENSFIISAAASLLDDDREIDTASQWAAPHVQRNPAIRWVLGKYVEADNANTNKQMWTLDGLRLAQPTVSHAPLNMLHRPKHIVGAFTATEMIYPTDEVAGESNHPYMEALAAMWRYYFPDELKIVEAAHNEGSLFFSMECVSNTITCAGEFGCNQEFAYAGPKSESYCTHLNDVSSIRLLNQPHFLAGALIVPPARPGWSGAQIKELAAMTGKQNELAHALYEQLKAESPQLTAEEWEATMLQLMIQAGYGVPSAGKPNKKSKKMSNPDAVKPNKKSPTTIAQEVLADQAKTFSTDQRNKMAKAGTAMPDGSFPIGNMQDLHNAIQSIGRAKNPAAAKTHIKKRAKALGGANLIPAGW